MVTAQELTEVIETQIHQSDAWNRCMFENYGAFYMRPDKKIQKLLYCVTMSKVVVDHCRKNGYDAVISHHPILSLKRFPQLVYHTALDCCENGLNDYWRDFLGIKNARHFDTNLGWTGQIDPISFKHLKDKIETKLETRMIGDSFNTQSEINSVVICTGLGGVVNEEALSTNADCYILGQSVCNPIKSGFRNIIEIGHTLSERIGFDCIKTLIKDLPVEFDMAPLLFDKSIYGETSAIH